MDVTTAEILAFITEFADATAWPIAAVVMTALALPVLKQPIAQLMARITNIKYGPAEIGLDSVPTPPAGSADAATIDDRTRRDIDASPRTSIIEAWVDFSWRIANLLGEHGITVENHSLASVVHALITAGVLETQTYDMVNAMQAIRDQAAHDYDVVFNAAVARKIHYQH